MNELYLVRQMHEKFLIGEDDSWKNLLFRTGAMQEELVEFTQASLKRDRVEQLDALIDLAVFLFGTLDQLGFTEEQWNDGFQKVMASNMGKELAQLDGKNSKRGHGTDLVKPAGWRPADLDKVVHERSLATIDRTNVKSAIDSALETALKNKCQLYIPNSRYNALINRDKHWWDSNLDTWLRKNYGKMVQTVNSKTADVPERTIIVNPQ